jgi:hypothetical protein
MRILKYSKPIFNLWENLGQPKRRGNVGKERNYFNQELRNSGKIFGGIVNRWLLIAG